MIKQIKIKIFSLKIFAHDLNISFQVRDMKLIESTIQETLNQIQKLANLNGFPFFSETKIYCTLFSNKRKIQDSTLIFKNQILKYESNTKFLGLIFDKKIKMD